MRDTLQNEFMVFVDYLETQSRTTFENAQYSAQILHSHGLTSIFLVTHAWHMPRAKQAFEHFGIKVIPAPTVFYGSPAPVSLGDFIPTTHALLVTSVAFHEIIGRIWYQVHYYQ